MADEGIEDTASLSPPGILEMWSVYRPYAEHESTLVNNRTTWLITIQSFLIATFGFSYQKELEVIGTISHSADLTTKMTLPIAHFSLFLDTLAWIGVGVSLIAGFSIFAAWLAIRHLKSKWANELPAFLSEDELRMKCMPPLTGGGGYCPVILGTVFAFSLPLGFCAAWLWILRYVLH